jgi:ABC-type antimicrobial peptide transport system permease subunit
VFYLRYIAAELRRRRGRTIITSLGLAVGVGMVATVVALSNGLDDAQSQVLEPLTGVGTDMSVARPIVVIGAGDGEQEFSAGGPLSASEQQRLHDENRDFSFDFSAYGAPGDEFTTRELVSADLSFPAEEADGVARLNGVAAVGRALTLTQLTISGTVPAEGEAPALGPHPGGGGASDTTFVQATVSGIDPSEPRLTLVTPDQVADGRYLRVQEPDGAILSRAYAKKEGYAIGDEVLVGERTFAVVGIAEAPLGGESSDLYVPLAELQAMSDRAGRINVLRVRAERADRVEAVAASIERIFKGSEVTTAQDLADRVSGSLVDAQSISDKLGVALAVVTLLAAFGIASLLTLSSVNKRTRELGTLKALGWRSRLVVRQVTGESVVQGLLGGIAGAVIGLGGAALVGTLGITLEAVTTADSPSAGFFGQGTVPAGSSTVTLDAPVDPAVIALAVGLAVLGGLIAGAVGGSRVARLRPAEALRSVE